MFKIDNLKIAFVWIVFFSAYPFVFSALLSVDYTLLLLCGLLLLFLILFRESKYFIDLPLFVVLSFQILFWSLQLLFRLDLSYLSNVFQCLIVMLIAMVYYSLSNRINLLKSYISIIEYMCIGGGIAFLLTLIFNMPPLFQYINHDGRLGRCFVVSCTNIYYSFAGFSLIRFSGYFDEPGALCFYVMYALIINLLISKKGSTEYILLLFPLLTFSLAHMITSVLYLILFKIKRLKSALFIGFIFSTLYFSILSTKGTQYEQIYNLSIGRLEVSANGEIKGDTRSDLYKISENYFINNFYFGKGKTFFVDNNIYVGSNFWGIGALYGIFGYLFYFAILMLIIYEVFITNKKLIPDVFLLKIIVLICVNYLQRPDVGNVFQASSLMFVYLSVLIYKKNNKYEIKEHSAYKYN